MVRCSWRRCLQVGLVSVALMLLVAALVVFESSPQESEPQDASGATVNSTSARRGLEPRGVDQTPSTSYDLMLAELMDRVNSRDEKERQEAFQALKDMRERDWHRFLSGANEMTGRRAEAAAKVIVESGPGSLNRITDYLSAEEMGLIHVPVLCARLLGDEALPYLIEQARSTSPRVRLWVAASLEDFIAQPARALPTLVSLATDRDEEVAIRALRSIQQAGTAAALYRDHLRRISSEARPAVRSAALAALSAIVPKNRALGDQLVEVATSANTAVDERLQAVEAIARLPRTPAILAALEKCLRDMDLRIQRSALDALLRGSPVPHTLGLTLLESLKTEKVSFADKRLKLVARLPTLHDSLEPMAVIYLGSANLLERRSAVACLATMRKIKPKTAVLVIQSLDDEDMVVRMKAVEALMTHRYDQDVRERLQKVHEKDPDLAVRQTAAMVLRERQQEKP